MADPEMDIPARPAEQAGERFIGELGIPLGPVETARDRFIRLAAELRRDADKARLEGAPWLTRARAAAVRALRSVVDRLRT